MKTNQFIQLKKKTISTLIWGKVDMKRATQRTRMAVVIKATDPKWMKAPLTKKNFSQEAIRWSLNPADLYR